MVESVPKIKHASEIGATFFIIQKEDEKPFVLCFLLRSVNPKLRKLFNERLYSAEIVVVIIRYGNMMMMMMM